MIKHIYLCCHTVFIFILIATTKKNVEARQLGTPAADFTRHTIVHPIVHHGKTKREIKSTRGTSGEHAKQVIVTMNLNGEDYVLDLLLNEDLIAKKHVISYQKDGETVLHTPTKKELDICQYSGKVRGRPDSWVAVSTCRGISGVIHDGDTLMYIEPAEGNKINAHFIYDHSDLKPTTNTQYSPRLVTEYPSKQTWEENRASRKKREAYNTNKRSRYLELVLVADNREFKASGENIDNVHRQYKDLANIINSLYAPLDIFVILVGVVIWTERDVIRIEEEGEKTLSNFVQYRRTRLLPNLTNDYANLVTHQNFTRAVGGMSYMGKICTDEYSGGISRRYSDVNGLIAVTIAHEIGHSLGMDDDAEGCECPDSNCIMNRYASYVMSRGWSSCSLGSLALSFKTGSDYCLRNVPSTECGNGIIEVGEDCDCGRSGVAADPSCTACCHPDHCTRRRDVSCFLSTLLTHHKHLFSKFE